MLHTAESGFVQSLFRTLSHTEHILNTACTPLRPFYYRRTPTTFWGSQSCFISSLMSGCDFGYTLPEVSDSRGAIIFAVNQSTSRAV